MASIIYTTKLWAFILCVVVIVYICINSWVLKPNIQNKYKPKNSLRLKKFDIKLHHLRQKEKGSNRKFSKDYVNLHQTEEILFFNRIPKTGSEMMDLVLKWLKEDNLFILQRLKNTKTRFLTNKEQMLMVNEVINLKKEHPKFGLVVDRHVYFTNFTSFGFLMPTYFALVRDPVDKLISRFYYARVTPRPGGYTPPGYVAPEPPKFSSLEDCLDHNDPECMYVPGNLYDLTIPYFCGHQVFCRELGNKAALAQAKRHVEEWYPVVGVLEHLNETLTTLENYVPKFFKGSLKKYYEGLKGIHYNKNQQKPKVNSFVRKKLQNHLNHEYDFYKFIKSRLLRKFKKIDKL